MTPAIFTASLVAFLLGTVAGSIGALAWVRSGVREPLPGQRWYLRNCGEVEVTRRKEWFVFYLDSDGATRCCDVAKFVTQAYPVAAGINGLSK